MSLTAPGPPPTLAPGTLRPDLDVYGYPLVPGCRVRAFGDGLMNEDGRIRGLVASGPYTDYIEGRLVSIGAITEGSYPCYDIADGIAVDESGSKPVVRPCHPPVNGTPTNFGRWTCAVARVVPGVDRQARADLAAEAVRERADTGLYRHDPDLPGDQDRAAGLLRHDLERAFGFAEAPEIPDAIRAKAFAIARRISFERCGRFVPRALVEDYAELAEILALGQSHPICFLDRPIR